MNNAVSILRNPATIRARAHYILDRGRDGKLSHFSVNEALIPNIADKVAAVIQENYPSLQIPYHGRWRHFTAGGVDRWGKLQKTFTDRDEMVRAAIDLAVISVLLDAGAGMAWAYTEDSSSVRMGRSEGLAIATFHMFREGYFSSDPANPLRVDAEGLAKLTSEQLAAGFQVNGQNPMAGLEGRIGLVKNLARTLKDRPGAIYDRLGKGQKNIRAADILGVLLADLSPIWPGRIVLDGKNLGDVWRHSAITANDNSNGLMPFHKLSQWLTYSLLEPFEWAGVNVVGLDELTGLPEYRNGGLFMDGGVLSLKNPDDLAREHSPDDELIVEWRALTVALLDELRLPVADRLGIPHEKFPLARLLEGGTWATGRKLARQRSATSEPPLKIISNGTVF